MGGTPWTSWDTLMLSFFRSIPPPAFQNLSPTPGGRVGDVIFYRARLGGATPFALLGALAARRLGPSMTIWWAR